MKIRIPLLIASLLAFAPSATAAGLTIYNEDFAVVRDSVPLELRAGVNDIRYDGATLLLEPDSVVLRDKSGMPLQILEQNYRNDPLTQGYLLSLFEGQTLDFSVREEQKPDRVIEGKILRSGYEAAGGNSEPVVEVDGKIQFGLPGKPQFPSLGGDTVLKPRLEWKIQSSAASKTEAELSYITGGLSWQASYNLVSPEKGDTLDVVGWITIENRSGRDFEDASMKLMAGDVSKIETPQEKGRVMAMAAMADAETVTERAFDEFHLYSLPRRTTLRDRETKQVEFLRAGGVKSETVYIFDGARDPKISVFREFLNTKENQLGIPLPKGRMRFYRTNGTQLEFTGESEIEHTPVDELMKIQTGNAFDLVGERKLTNSIRDEANHRAVETFEILLKNRKTEPVTIRVVEHLRGYASWKVSENSDPFEKKASDEIEFRIPVKPGDERKVVYTATYTW